MMNPTTALLFLSALAAARPNRARHEMSATFSTRSVAHTPVIGSDPSMDPSHTMNMSHTSTDYDITYTVTTTMHHSCSCSSAANNIQSPKPFHSGHTHTTSIPTSQGPKQTEHTVESAKPSHSGHSHTSHAMSSAALTVMGAGYTMLPHNPRSDPTYTGVPDALANDKQPPVTATIDRGPSKSFGRTLGLALGLYFLVFGVVSVLLIALLVK
jgi:hypothetical protein